MTMLHTIAVTAATSADMAEVRRLVTIAAEPHRTGRAKVVDSLTGCHIAILGNGALVRDVVNALDKAGWME